MSSDLSSLCLSETNQTSDLCVVRIDEQKVVSQTHQIYKVVCYDKEIQTTVTCNPKVVTKWITSVEAFHRKAGSINKLIVGLGIQWRHKSRPTKEDLKDPLCNKTSTIELCVGNRCLIFQFFYAGGEIPQTLVSFLENKKCTFVGIGVEHDLEKLVHDYDIGRRAKCVELALLAGDVYGDKSLKDLGLNDLAKKMLNWEIVKLRKVKLSRWDNEALTSGQVLFAALDVIVAFEIGLEMNAIEYVSVPTTE